MDDLKIGAAARAIRIRRGWRQADLADRAGVSQGLVSLLERGQLVHLSVVAMRRIFAALDARLDMRVDWRGGEIDRLLDERHAGIAEVVARTLHEERWGVRAEVSFARYGERGSIDLLGWNAAAGAVLVVEVKSAVFSLEETLRRLDVKRRLAPEICGAELGWRPRVLGVALVVPESSGARRRLERHSSTLASVFPDRGQEVRRWLRQPDRSLAAVWFLSGSELVRPGRLVVGRIRVPRLSTPSDSNAVAAVMAERTRTGPSDAAEQSRAPSRRTSLLADERAELARSGFVVDGSDAAQDR